MEKKTKTTKAVSKKAKTVAVGSAPIYTTAGKEIGTIELPEAIFGLSWNADLVHQTVYSMLSDARTVYAHTKDRGDVRGGGKKPWRQKGTGRARHGSSRSPIWVGGGIAHGPNGKVNYARKVNKKAKAKALFTILSKKFRDGEVIFVDSIEIAKPKTVDALAVLKGLSKVAKDILTKKKNSALITLSAKKAAVEKSFANIGNVSVDEMRNINPVDLLNKKYLVIENPEAAVAFLSGKMSKNK